MSSLKIRTITAIALVLVIVPVLILGGITIDIFGGILTILAAWELERMHKKDNKWERISFIRMALSTLTYVILVVSLRTSNYILIPTYLLFLFVLVGILFVINKSEWVESFSFGLITLFYPSIGFASLISLRNLDIPTLWRGGFFLIAYVAVVCSMTDTFAYFFGIKFGKHRLAPVVSPKKSWEGSIAGTVFGTILGVLFAHFTGVGGFIFSELSVGWQVVALVPLTVLLSIIDEFGDLFASKLKRHYGIKDYSNLFPGHGGVLDRFDSYLFAATFLLFFIL